VDNIIAFSSGRTLYHERFIVASEIAQRVSYPLSALNIELPNEMLKRLGVPCVLNAEDK
jgi:hypothetical protein